MSDLLGSQSPPSAYHPDETDELAYQIINLGLLCEAFHGGCYTLYKAAIVPLRTLLLQSSGCTPLALAIPNLELPRLRISNPTNDGVHFTMPCDVEINGLHLLAGVGAKHLNFAGGATGQTKLGDLFETGTLPLASWLKQPFLAQSLSLEAFIRHVAHKDGGAHFEDGDVDIQRYEDCASIHWPLTAKIGEAVARSLWAQFEATHPGYTIRVP